MHACIHISYICCPDKDAPHAVCKAIICLFAWCNIILHRIALIDLHEKCICTAEGTDAKSVNVSTMSDLSSFSICLSLSFFVHPIAFSPLPLFLQHRWRVHRSGQKWSSLYHDVCFLMSLWVAIERYRHHSVPDSIVSW